MYAIQRKDGAFYGGKKNGWGRHPVSYAKKATATKAAKGLKDASVIKLVR